VLSDIDDILRANSAGQLEGNLPMTTMRDVAARAGVSAKTVSRVLRKDRYVTDEVRARVLAAVDELQYVPNTLALTFRSGQDTAIGIAVPDIADPFFGAIIKAVEIQTRRRGVPVIVSSLGYEPHREQEAVETLLKRQVRGLICCPVAADQSYLKPWQHRTPMVFIDRSPLKLTADSVVEDDLGGAETMVRHLIEHGHRRIAFIGDSTRLSTTTLRLQGYHEALERAGLPADEGLLHLGGIAPDHLDEALSTFRSLRHPPTALFSSNGRLSMAVLPAVRRMGWSEVALVSFGDFPMAQYLDPAITVMDQDPDSVGRAAAERLFARIAEPNRRLKRRIVLPVNLVERQSCHLREPVLPRSGRQARSFG
jgi:LacI family transcriptional regulator